jgi:hypothetical protein
VGSGGGSGPTIVGDLHPVGELRSEHDLGLPVVSVEAPPAFLSGLESLNALSALAVYSAIRTRG